MKFTFNTEEILSKLRLNREEHIKIVKEAQKGMRIQWRAMLTKALTALDDGGPVETFLNLQIPPNHTKDFDRAIQMFEMTTDKEVRLDEASFQMFVRNQWHWQRQFLATNSAYSESALSLHNQEED